MRHDTLGRNMAELGNLLRERQSFRCDRLFNNNVVIFGIWGMTNDDRELIVLAGKAAGLDVFYDDFHDGDPCYYDTTDCVTVWNPLEDDGDAFRLAVRLGITVHQNIIRVEASTIALTLAGMTIRESILDNDPVAATRRAIVRAAAEIGRSLP